MCMTYREVPFTMTLMLPSLSSEVSSVSKLVSMTWVDIKTWVVDVNASHDQIEYRGRLFHFYPMSEKLANGLVWLLGSTMTTGVRLTLLLSKSFWGLTIGHGPDPNRWPLVVRNRFTDNITNEMCHKYIATNTGNWWTKFTQISSSDLTNRLRAVL